MKITETSIAQSLQKGGAIAPVTRSFESFLRYYGKKKDDPTYNTERAYELYKKDPTNFEGTIANMEPDGWHFSTVDPETGIFLKRGDHESIKKELDWYNHSADWSAVNQRLTKDIDKSKPFWKYVDKGKGTKIPFKQMGGNLQNLIESSFRSEVKKVPQLLLKTADDVMSVPGNATNYGAQLVANRLATYANKPTMEVKWENPSDTLERLGADLGEGEKLSVNILADPTTYMGWGIVKSMVKRPGIILSKRAQDAYHMLTNMEKTILKNGKNAEGVIYGGLVDYANRNMDKTVPSKQRGGTFDKTYNGGEIEPVTVTRQAPEWSVLTEKYRKAIPSSEWAKKNLPSRGLGMESYNNLSAGATERYDRFINNKVSRKLLANHLNGDAKDFIDRYGRDNALKGFTPKELDIIRNSDQAHVLEASDWEKFRGGLAGTAEMFINNMSPNKPIVPVTIGNSTEKNPLNVMAPLDIPGKVVRSAYKDNSILDALKGKQDGADFQEQFYSGLAADVGAGIAGGLIKKGFNANIIPQYKEVLPKKFRVETSAHGAADGVVQTRLVGDFKKEKDVTLGSLKTYMSDKHEGRIPSMIEVTPKIRGNKVQDLLYDEHYRYLKDNNIADAIRTGDALLSRDATRKMWYRSHIEPIPKTGDVWRNGETDELVFDAVYKYRGSRNPNIKQDVLSKLESLPKSKRTENTSVNKVIDKWMAKYNTTPKQSAPPEVPQVGNRTFNFSNRLGDVVDFNSLRQRLKDIKINDNDVIE